MKNLEVESLVPGMQQVLIKVSCCHYEPPTLTYTFRFSGAWRGRDQSWEPRNCHRVGDKEV